MQKIYFEISVLWDGFRLYDMESRLKDYVRRIHLHIMKTSVNAAKLLKFSQVFHSVLSLLK